MAATALTRGHVGKSATCLSGGVEATTASGEAETATSQSGGVEVTTCPDEAQSGHVANDSYGTEETGINTRSGQEQKEQVAKDSYKTEWKASAKRANWSPDKHPRVKLGKRSFAGWIRGERLRERRNRKRQVQEQEDQRARNHRRTDRNATTNGSATDARNATSCVQSGLQKMPGHHKRGTEKRRNVGAGGKGRADNPP